MTHNLVLKPEQLGQPAGEKIYRCCWVELEGALGPSSVQSAQNAAVGYRVGGVPLFADKMWVGMSALSWAISHPSTHMCLQAESATAPILMQLREVLFLWGILDP